MLLSMTGFGKAQGTLGSTKVDVEINSLNSRFLDLFFSLPEPLEPFEIRVREKIRNKVKRGRVRVRIWMESLPFREDDIRLNLPLLKKLVNELEKVESKKVSLHIDLAQLLRTPGIFEGFMAYTFDESAWDQLEPIIDKAIEELLKSQKKEGKKLEKEITSRLNNIESLVGKIEKLKDVEIEKQKEKAREILVETVESDPETDQRISQELAYWAMKLDVAEEIARIRAHLQQFREIVKSRETLKGRKLEFLCQELHREATTLSQKSFSPNIVSLTIGMREEIERIREQVRNVV